MMALGSRATFDCRIGQSEGRYCERTFNPSCCCCLIPLFFYKDFFGFCVDFKHILLAYDQWVFWGTKNFINFQRHVTFYETMGPKVHLYMFVSNSQGGKHVNVDAQHPFSSEKHVFYSIWRVSTWTGRVNIIGKNFNLINPHLYSQKFHQIIII